MTARFLVPSLVWYGLEPPLDGPRLATGVRPLAEWGGQLTDPDSVRALLLTLDPAILLLNLAGYQVRQVVAAVAKAAAETKLADLLSVDTSSMLITRGTTLEWVDPAPGLVSAHAALWVEPHFPAARPGLSSVTLDLAALPFPLEGEGIAIRFFEDGTGWLHCSWPASALTPWYEVLPGQVTTLFDALSEHLATAYGAAAESGRSPPVAGLLSLYDRTTWTVANETELPSGLAAFGARVQEIAFAGDATALSAFLAEEAPTLDGDAPVPPAPAVVERFGSPTDAAVLSDAVDDIVNGSLVIDPDGAPLFASDGYADATALPLTSLLLRWQETGALDFLTMVAPADDRYGGYDLQEGDNDTGTIYGGLARRADAGDDLPPLGAPGFVAQLRVDLAELGFGPAFSYAADEVAAQAFTVELELAVREFQIAATSPNLAAATIVGPQRFYADGLAQVQNPSPYTGPISGVVNADTRALIGLWLQAALRCPVVIEARTTDATGAYTNPFDADEADNVWRDDQITSTKPRIFVRDLSGMYPLEGDSADKHRHLDLFALGAWTSSGFGNGPWAKPPDHVWAEREVLAEHLVGASFDALTAMQRSTFRAVRAVAEVECLGFFDSFNAYDRGVMSLGPCHWTVALVKGGLLNEPAELPAYFAYLDGLGGAAAQAAEAALERFGCGIDRVWPGGVAREGAGTCWEPGLRKYVARVTLDREAGPPLVLEGTQVTRAEWFRQWHWCYRLSMAARTMVEYRRRMWDYARIRLRDLLATPWSPTLITIDPVLGPVQATVGDVFTSERAAGLLLRWHVNAPSDLLPMKGTSKLTLAFQDAGAAGFGDPADWGDAEETALTDALYARRPESLKNWLRLSLDHVYNWTTSTAWDYADKNGDVHSKTWESERRAAAWTLTPAMVSGVPSIAGLANHRTNVDTAATLAFSVAFRDIVGTPLLPTARSSNQAVVRDTDLRIDPDGAAFQLTATPVTGATGTARITVTADNGAHVANTEFSLRVGPPGDDAAPVTVATEGLSVRRKSLQLAWEDLA